MKHFFHSSRSEQFAALPYIGKWLVIATVVAALAGSASAIFLITLDQATAWREAHRWIIWLLPGAGFGVGLVYHLVGKPVDGGNNLIIDEIHDPKKVIPLRMVPLVLGGTVVSHLFGASVGREGTAVQMGGALADQLTHVFRIGPDDRRILLMSGMSAGFAAVFGTPLAGALFGLEVLAIGRMRYDALFPCLVSAVVADQVCLAWGVHHVHYTIGQIVPVSFWSMAAVVVAGILFGLVGMVFAATTHRVSAEAKRLIAYAPLRPAIGGIVIAVAVWSLDAYHYIGLGIPDILRAFHEPMAPWDFLGKLLFTVASLGTGFKGGEVTPLFYIGATLGNALAPVLHLPFAMLAGIGFVAVFAGAANTPIATTLMAIELFGPAIGPFAAVGCVTAYFCSGHAGIYHAQRIGNGKYRRTLPEDLRLADLAQFNAQQRDGAPPAASSVKQGNNTEDAPMNTAPTQPSLAALRLYFPMVSKARATRFWHHLSAPALAQHLLTAAKKAEIRQAILHRVNSGYLPGEQLSHHYPELTSMRHPQCLELLDTEARLRAFLQQHADELAQVHAVLFLCELVSDPLAGTDEPSGRT